MITIKRLAIVLLLVSLASAIAPYTIFPCEPIDNYDNIWYFNRGYASAEVIGNCAGTTERLNNIKFYDGADQTTSISTSAQELNFTIGATGAQTYIYLFNLTKINGATINLTTSTISDLVYYYNATSYYICTNVTKGTLTFVQTAPNIYNITNGTTTCGGYNTEVGDRQFRVGTFTGATTIRLSIMNVSELREFMPNTATGWQKLTITTPLFRITKEGGTAIVPNYISKAWGTGFTANDTFPSTGVFNATLIGSSAVLKPIHSFYPISTRQFSRAYSNTTLLIKILNNTDSYIEDINGGWFFCPAYAATSFVLPLTIVCQPVTTSTVLTTSVTIPTYESIWDDLTYTLTPVNSWQATPFNITFNLTSNSSALQYWGMNITKNANSTITYVYFNNSTAAAGGIMKYEVNGSGRYLVYLFMKDTGFAVFAPFPKTYYYGNSTGLSLAREDFASQQPISGWAFYFIAVICAMVAAGFASRFSQEGAAIIALIILWGASLIYPTAPIYGILTPLTATIITTLGTIGWMYAKPRFN